MKVINTFTSSGLPSARRKTFCEKAYSPTNLAESTSESLIIKWQASFNSRPLAPNSLRFAAFKSRSSAMYNKASPQKPEPVVFKQTPAAPKAILVSISSVTSIPAIASNHACFGVKDRLTMPIVGLFAPSIPKGN